MTVHVLKAALTAVAVCAGLACGAALAQSPGAEAARARAANFKAMGKTFKAVNEQLKSPTPDFAVIKGGAAEVNRYALALPSWFPKGSGPESGVKMDAKPVVWTDPQGFAAAARAYQIEASRLAALSAASTDVAALSAQVKATGKTCGACHDTYREKD